MTVLQPDRFARAERAGAGRPGAVPMEHEARVGYLVVDTSFSPLSPQLASCPVAVTVDDLPLQVRWGRTDIALLPGRHRVEIAVERGTGWGRVVEEVPVAAGHSVDVFYRAPVRAGRPGAIGPVPQPTRGAASLIAVLVVVALLAIGTTVAGLALIA